MINVQITFEMTIIKLFVDWGEYGAFSQCSITCGEGIMKRERQCIGGDPGQAGCPGSAFMEMVKIISIKHQKLIFSC